MKILIIYASKNGVAKKAAEKLSAELSATNEISLYDINNTPPSPENFDVVVLGGSIRMTKLDKKLKSYLKEHLTVISEKQSAFFICCGIIRDVDDYKATELPSKIKFSLGIECFGGELKPDKVHGFDKIFTKRLNPKLRKIL